MGEELARAESVVASDARSRYEPARRAAIGLWCRGYLRLGSAKKRESVRRTGRGEGIRWPPIRAGSALSRSAVLGARAVSVQGVPSAFSASSSFAKTVERRWVTREAPGYSTSRYAPRSE